MECVPCTRWALATTGQRPIWLCQSEFGHSSLGGKGVLGAGLGGGCEYMQ